MDDEKSSFTSKQLKFIEAYNGNGTEAARIAGYSGDDNALGVIAHTLLRNVKIVRAIRARESVLVDDIIATRKERQELWSSIMNDEDVSPRDRLRASELLGKSEADFIEKVEHTGKMSFIESLSDEQINERIEALLNKKNEIK